MNKKFWEMLPYANNTSVISTPQECTTV